MLNIIINIFTNYSILVKYEYKTMHQYDLFLDLLIYFTLIHIMSIFMYKCVLKIAKNVVHVY